MALFGDYRADGLDQIPEDYRNKYDIDDDDVASRPICRDYVIYRKFSSSYYWVTSITIIIFNAIFYMIVHPMISLIGHATRTEEIKLTSFTVFCCLVADVVFLPVFIGMNMMEHNDSKISEAVFKGKYTDFNGEWYTDVGF